jgi:hypothetical protein
LPANLPAPSHATQYQYAVQGKTRVWFFTLPGTADQLPALRDSYDRQLTAKGYEIEGHDQEENSEAEADFRGPHDGTTNFRPLCSGLVVLRVKLNS